MPLDFHLASVRDSDLQHKLGDLLASHMASADLLGRMQILRHAHKRTGRMLPLAMGRKPVQFAEDQDPVATAGFSFDLPDDKSAELIAQLTPVTRQLFDGLTAQYRRDAFTMAGVSDVRLIQKIRDALAETARKGETIDDWKKAVAQLTSEAGVEDLNAFTLDTAFQTAMQKAYSAGRLEQMQEPHMIDALPFWQYWTAGDMRVRPGHAQLDGFLARAIDPVWRRIYPPWDFGCRCSVVNVPEDEALKLDPNCAEGGLERIASKAFTMLELHQSDFRSLMAR
ncbi:MAG: phage minor head protein [Terracidiphilus sp.]|nr:phage minor head protein [Terracidiphilus sp.]